jgi:uncharacterized protein
MTSVVMAIAIGALIGVVSGVVGIGGGALLTPILIYFYGMTQKDAQGTSLCMLLAPSGALAFWEYYKGGHANVKIGLLVALGVLVGGYFGGSLAQRLPDVVLRRVFALFLVAIAVKMFVGK